MILGPDLNPKRGPLDKKNYRQVLLDNGLRCLLIEDVYAMPAELDADNDSQSSSTVDNDDDGDAKYEDDEEGDSEYEDDEPGLRDAAACLLVGAGSMYDPPECQGLAHFLEHLLFMGSEKYPDENEYDVFVSKHGGCSNAWTEWEATVYSLEIPQDSLWGALDRLAQFFIQPLMLPSAVDRELLAIESEFSLNKNSDTCRWQQLLCATTDPAHPLGRFSWGNLRSLREIPAQLGIDPLQELWKFYRRYYYAANMRLVVVGAYSLDVLQEKVTHLFGKVPSLPREEPPFRLPINPDTVLDWNAEYNSPMADLGSPMTEDLGHVFRIIPVKERHSLSITWPLPPLFDNWRSKPADYLSHLLGHEAEGSLLSYFRSKSWATACVASAGTEGSERASSHWLLTANFTLSEEGLNEWPQLVAAVYAYIGMLRDQCRIGWPEWIYEELRATDELAYRYGDEQSPDELVEHLAENMAPHHRLPAEHTLDGNCLLFEFDPSTVQRILDDYLTPQNARIDLSSSLFGRPNDFDEGTAKEGTSMRIENLIVHEETGSLDRERMGEPQTEPMFGTHFWCSAVPEAWMEEWRQLAEPQHPTLPIRLPSKNPFVPTRLELKKLPAEDSHHPLVNCSVKLCVTVGKTKQWFPATVTRYNSKKQALLMSYEGEDEKWHSLDNDLFELAEDRVRPDFEGFLDKKKVKFRVLATAAQSRGVMRYGDESDFDVEDGKAFPPIPAALPPDRLPKLIANSNKLKLWWLQDRQFHRPIADLRLQIVCATGNKSPLHRVCAELLRTLCEDTLLEVTYMASVCELHYSIAATDEGFNIWVEGFDDKLLALFEKVMGVFLSFVGKDSGLPETIQPERFTACLEVLRRRLRNQGMSAAQLGTKLRLRALRPTIWSAFQKLNALNGMDTATFAKTVSSLFEGYAIEGLYHGNADRSDAEQAKALIASMLEEAGGAGLPRKKYPPQSVHRIPAVDQPLCITAPSKDAAEPNTSVEIYFQIGKDNLHDRVMIDLLVHLMEEPFFDQLRTKEQFGYDVSCDHRWSYGIMGLVFHVVTNVKSADEVVARVDEFLTNFRAQLESSDDFMEQLVGLATHKLDMFNSLREETDSYWQEIRDGRFHWQSWRDEAIVLRNTTKEDALKAFDKWLMPDQRRHILAVKVIGNGDGDAAKGRPIVESEALGDYYQQQVTEFHKLCKKQTWGRVNSKLF